MGKWAEVDCNCINREPLPNSNFYDQPYFHKGSRAHLTTKQQEEVEEWKRTTLDMYACGHRLGILVELHPGDIVFLGRLIESIFKDMEGEFEIFPRVGNWRCYIDEELPLSPEEASLWLLEIEEIKNAMDGFGNIPREKIENLIIQFFLDEPRIGGDWERLEHEASLKQALLEQKKPTIDVLQVKLRNTLADATKLCQASIETGNPVKMLW
jgi:hypothetical protein